VTVHRCHYCRAEEPVELRPYGPGGAYVCYPCATSPEHEQATIRRYQVQLAAAAVIGGGIVTIGVPDGPQPGTPQAKGSTT
jgi:hypothetical protein